MVESPAHFAAAATIADAGDVDVSDGRTVVEGLAGFVSCSPWTDEAAAATMADAAEALPAATTDGGNALFCAPAGVADADESGVATFSSALRAHKAAAATMAADVFAAPSAKADGAVKYCEACSPGDTTFEYIGGVD